MVKRADLVAAYLEALGCRALLVLAVPGGQPSKVSFQPDRKLDTFDTFHFIKAQHAELVALRTRADLEAIGAMRSEDWVDLPAREVRDAIVNASAQLGAIWQTSDQVHTQAQAAVDEIIAHVEVSRASGGLAQVNAAYKRYRQQQQASGQKAVPYSAHLGAFTKSLVTLAAKNAR
jgi:hypothetical protein